MNKQYYTCRYVLLYFLELFIQELSFATIKYFHIYLRPDHGFWRYSRCSLIRTPDNVNSRYIELKSVPIDLINPYNKRTHFITNFLPFPLRVRISERILYVNHNLQPCFNLSDGSHWFVDTTSLFSLILRLSVRRRPFF